MNERLVEDWLTKASERSFQTPFAQSLLADGMEVLRVAHSAHEHGKDIIAVDQRGKVHAYQLKEGDLDLSGFERIHGQLVALVESQVEHPALKGNPRHQSFLVITGNATTPVEDRIRVHNKAWRKRGYGPLRLINRAQLLVKFNRMAENFWPQQPEESRRLLSLYLADGSGNLDRVSFSKLVTSLTLVPSTQPKTETARRLAAANLFSSYALAPYYSAANNWEAVQGWTIAAANIAWAADVAKLPAKTWRPTFRLAVDAARSALDSLVNEALQPNALGPGPTLELDELTRSRCTLCSGAIAAKLLIARSTGEEWQLEPQAKKTLEDLFTKGRLVLWGESSVPFFLATVWALDLLRPDSLADRVLLSILGGISRANAPRTPHKLPPPHESADEANDTVFRKVFEEKAASEDLRAAISYTLEPLVFLAAGRLLRNTLASLWSQITNISIIRLVPDHPRDLLLWNWGHERGREESRLFGTPQSWKQLLEEVRRNEDSALPSVLLSDIDFAWLFLITHPHRLTRPAAKYFEAARKRAA